MLLSDADADADADSGAAARDFFGSRSVST